MAIDETLGIEALDIVAKEVDAELLQPQVGLEPNLKENLVIYYFS